MTRKRQGLTLSRRDLLKFAQVGGLGAAAGGLVLLGRPSAAQASVKGVCRLCTMHCGVVATVVDGRLTRLEGDRESKTRGFICQHGMAMREVVHHRERLHAPLRRKGGDFEEVSWEVALEEIAGRMNAIKAQHGAHAVAVQTGWPFVRHPLVPFLQRFCLAFGTPNLATVASLCESVGRMGRALTGGMNWWPDVPRARTVVIWGANPVVTAPPFAGLIAGATRRGRHLVVVDPVRTELARHAHLHLAVKPGTDGALALGMIRLILAEGWEDKAFIDANTAGIDGLRQAAEPWTPARVAAETGIAPEPLRQAAQWIAQAGPTSIWEGLGLEHHVGALQATRAVSCLQAICGWLDVPGGGGLHGKAGRGFADDTLPVQWKMSTPQPVPPPVAAHPIGYDEFPLFEATHRQAQGNLFADAILDDKPYPLRGLILVASNAFITSPDSGRMQQAAGKLDLLVSLDPFLSASGRLSHYVLPATTFAEAPTVNGEDDDVEAGGLVREVPGARPDWRVLFDLARALGLGAYFPWNDFAAAMAAPRVPYMADEAHALRPDPALAGQPPPRFPTRSGKIELASTLLPRFGHAALPEHVPPPPTTTQFPLRLVTGPRTRVYINSQFHQVASLRLQVPAPPAQLHPVTAERLGIIHGDRVRVRTANGAVEMVAHVHDGVLPEVVVIPGGWAEASANQLTHTRPLDPVSGFPAFRSLICRVEKV